MLSPGLPLNTLFLDEILSLNRIFYHIFLGLYKLGIRIAGLWSTKARKWFDGRKNFPDWKTDKPVVWMHCASLGEFEQGRPVLESVRKEFPGYAIALSFFSPSGYEIRKNYNGADYVFYLPADSPANARKLVKMLEPKLVLWVKYEYWYYFLREIHDRKIPLLLISGIFRKSQPFFKGYGGMWREMLGFFTQLFVQNEKSVGLLNELNVSNHLLAGDTRFDRVIDIAENAQPINIVEEFVRDRKTVVAGSTWREDEIELFHFVRARKDIAFVIAPHEISEERIHDILKEFPGAIRYSEIVDGKVPDAECHVLIIDNIGMLAFIYRYADVCVVGGGFSGNGVHNVLEAAVYYKPVLYGPEHEKFQETIDLVECGGGFSPTGPLELEKILNDLFTDDELRKKSGEAAGNYVRSRRGATKIILDYIQRNRLLIN